MSRWILKAFVQGALAQLPSAQRYNRLFQRYVTYSLDLSDAQVLAKWQHLSGHLEAYRRLGGQGAPVTLELGTGWFPIVPVGLALQGVARIFTVDRESLIGREALSATLLRYAELARRGEIVFSDSGASARLRDLATRAENEAVETVLGALGIQPIIGDARALNLASESVDLLCSNNTLEHIPEDAIGDILREFRRLAAPGAVMSHHIDLSDHYAHGDRSITVYNFLKYSDRVWPLFNNQLQYQNRLRLSDYRRLHEEGGWRIVDEQTKGEPLEVLRQVRVAARFRGYTEADLAVHNAWITSRKI